MQTIQISCIRKHPGIMWTILLHIPTLDPFTILTNSRVLLLKDDKDLVSFIAIKNYWSNYELWTVYTYPSWRKKWYAKTLITEAIQRYQPIGLLCKDNMIHFYEKYGFVVEDDCFTALKIRRKLFNILLAPFLRYTIVSMIYRKS